MKLVYKNFTLIKDDYCWTLIQSKEYNKLDKLGGVPTGEVGVKEETIGYYPLDISIVLAKLATLLVEDVDTIESYIKEYERVTQDLKQFIKNECSSNSR